MGYQSDVTIAFYTQGDDRIDRFPAMKLWFDENYPREVAKTEWGAEIEYGDTFILITYTGVKWYHDYDHVRHVNRTCGRFEETFEADEDGKASWELVRIGEEVNDIEVESSQWADWRIDVRRYAEFN